MTVSTAEWRKVYVGDAATVAFAFANKFFLDADLRVQIRVIATGVTTLQTITTHYTVSGAGADAGGTVTMVAAPAATEQLIITRLPSIVQNTDLISGGDLSETAVEDALDLLTMQLQRMATYDPHIFFAVADQSNVSTEADIVSLTAIDLPDQPSDVMNGIWEISGHINGLADTVDTKAIVQLYGGATGDKGDTLKQAWNADWTVSLNGQVAIPAYYYLPTDTLHTKIGLSLQGASTLDLFGNSSTTRSYLTVRRVA